MSRFFYVKKGKKQGPVGVKEILSLLKAKKLGPLDLLAQEGRSEWLSLVDYPELAENLKAHPQPAMSDQWVVLKKLKNRFRQQGPYATQEVRDLLKAGEIAYTDLGWREGMSEWYVLKDLKEFKKKPPQRLDFGETSEPKMDFEVSSSENIIEEGEDEEDETWTLDESISKSSVPVESSALKVERPKKEEWRDKEFVERRWGSRPTVRSSRESRKILGFFYRLLIFLLLILIAIFVVAIIG